MAAGRDVQGIPWHILGRTRAQFRRERLLEPPVAEVGEVPPAGGYMDEAAGPMAPLDVARFRYCTRRVRCSIMHFQLRNLVWAPTPHDVYVLQQEQKIVHWDSVTTRRRVVLDLSGADPLLSAVQVSTIMAAGGLLVAGGLHSELVAVDARTGRVLFNGHTSTDEQSITNAVDMHEDASHGVRVVTSSNDCGVREYDGSTFDVVNHTRCGWAVNHASRQPRGDHLLAVAGDDKDCLLLDMRVAAPSSGAVPRSRVVAALHGHTTFAFATAWHPGGNLLATGSQDRTARVWDVRTLGGGRQAGSTTTRCVAVLPARVGPVRSVRFSSCGRLLAVAEPKDFVHLYDVSRGVVGDGKQTVDLFGEVGGACFTPDGRSLFIGVHDGMCGSLLQYDIRATRRADFVAAGL